MAIPLKNGADLYNFEVLRMRFHNLGADPTSDFGVGQVYFNTSTSEGSGKRVRIYDGSAFRSLAYFDEIDNRLKLLEGEIDTDAIISNMKEVSAFLAGFAEDASLMDVLNGKLDKTGGTITSSEYDSFIIKRTSATAGAFVTFENNNGRLGIIGIEADSGTYQPVVYHGSNVSSYDTLLHSGNVGKYKAGDADKLDGLHAESFFRHRGWLASGTDLNTVTDNSIQMLNGDKGAYENSPVNYGNIISFGDRDADYNFGKVQFVTSSGTALHYRNNFGGWKDWKTIAFTDSNVASATKLEDDTAFTAWGQTFFRNGKPVKADGSLVINGGSLTMTKGQIFRFHNTTDNTFIEAIGFRGDTFHIGYGNSGLYDTYIQGNNIVFRSGSRAEAMRINSSGNVGIGATKPTEKLHVVGNLYVTGNIIADGEVSAGGAGEEGDAGTGTGGGDALIYSQEFTPTTTSITITHNLSATKGVIVQVWEKNGNLWDMVLVDVEEVDTNTVTLFFGKTETTVHKVVIMG